MLRLRLFRRDDPANQIDSRTLDEGELSIGRDAKSDWRVDDPERAISRQHLVIRQRGGMLTVRDTSANGVFIGNPRTRLERDRATPIGRGESISFGTFLLVVEDEERVAPLARDGIPRDASPFSGPDPLDAGHDAPRSRKPQPFASALTPDPFADGSPVGDGDAWDRRLDPPAGSWNVGAARGKADHATLIGSERAWQEPPRSASVDAGLGFDAPFSRPILKEPIVPADAASIPSDWMESPGASGQAVSLAAEPALAEAPILPQPATPEPPQPAAAHPDAPASMSEGGHGDMLFEHFCAGAGLSPAAFAGQDRAAVMERLGAVYRQAVLGIADLMQERTALRNEYRMVHTTVRPEGNNPFKWVPPQRIAVELLHGEGRGYTTGALALAEALHDLKAHLLCMLAGMRAALTTTFDALSPAALEARQPHRNYLIKAQRDAALWQDFVEIAERLRAEADDNAGGLINRAFRQAYEEQAAQLARSAGDRR